MKKIIDLLFGPSKSKKIIIDRNDNFAGTKFSLLDLIQSLETRIVGLEERYKNALLDIHRLEQENIATTNALYELENRVLAKIDAHCPPIYNMNQYSLGDK